MRFKRAIGPIVLTLAVSLVRGGAEVVLQDGQVIKGSGVRRDGDLFLVDLEGGGIVTLPAALVSEVRLGAEAERKPQPSTGVTYTGPQVLAGQDVKPPTAAEQTAVLGEPSKWAQAPTNPDWAPKDAWEGKSADNWNPSQWAEAPVDPNWQPTSAWDTNKDTLAGSRSTWQKGPVDSTWTPSDGFKKTKTGFVLGGAASAMAASPAGTESAWACGEKIFSPDHAASGPALAVKPLEDKAARNLGLPLYEAEGERGGAKRRAVFTVTGGACRLVGGDLGPLLGVELAPSHAVALAASSYSSAVGAAGPALKSASGDPVEYAFAVVSLADPEVSGASRARMVLLASRDELDAIAKKKPGSCSLARGKRKKETKKAARQVTVPKVATGTEGEVVTFYTWSSAGGAVFRNEVYLAKNGVLSVHRDPIAAHMGDHRD